MSDPARNVIRGMLNENELEGGLGDDKSPSDFCHCQVIAGMAVEIEHTDDAGKALEITLDHLAEDPFYYSNVIPADEVKSALSKIGKTVLEKAKQQTDEAASGGAIGGLSSSGQLSGAGQPSSFVAADEPSPLNRKRRKKRGRKGSP